MADKIDDVLAKLETLAPQSAAEMPRPEVVLARLRVQPRSQSRWARWLTNLFGGGRRLAWAGAFVLLLAVAFSFPGVRVAAGEFLGSFRVQRFAPISISPQQIALLQEIAEQGHMPGEFEQVSEPGPLERVNSVGEASDRAGFAVRLPRALAEPDVLEVAHPGDMRFVIDLAGSRAILTAAGLDPALLPDGIDGQAVDVSAYNGVTALWSEGLVLFQTPAPEVTYPAGVDLQVLGQAALQFLGMSELEAAAAAATIDWTSTFVLPIPTELATYEEVKVDGVPGLMINSLDGAANSLIWQNDGVVYLLTAEKEGEAALLAIANSLP